jgi:hypothetical protein
MSLFILTVLLGCESEAEDTSTCLTFPCEEAPPLCSDAGDADEVAECLCIHWQSARSAARAECDLIDEAVVYEECPNELDDWDEDTAGKFECFVAALGEDCSVREDDAWEGYFQNAKECPWG